MRPFLYSTFMLYALFFTLYSLISTFYSKISTLVRYKKGRGLFYNARSSLKLKLVPLSTFDSTWILLPWA